MKSKSIFFGTLFILLSVAKSFAITCHDQFIVELYAAQDERISCNYWCDGNCTFECDLCYAECVLMYQVNVTTAANNYDVCCCVSGSCSSAYPC
jgi:hypothetical protein